MVPNFDNNEVSNDNRIDRSRRSPFSLLEAGLLKIEPNLHKISNLWELYKERMID